MKAVDARRAAGRLLRVRGWVRVVVVMVCSD